MLNWVWLILIVSSIVYGMFNGKSAEMVISVTDSAKMAFELALGMTGIMAFWLGLMRIAESSGLVKVIAKGLTPLMVRLFPEVPAEDPAMGEMILNISANMLGLTNAATPFGLRAMQSLQKLNTDPKVASNAMCLFLAINTSSVQLIPTTAIALLAANGAMNPTSVIVPALLATLVSTVVAISAAKYFQRYF